MAATSTGRCNTCGFAVGATLPTTLHGSENYGMVVVEVTLFGGETPDGEFFDTTNYQVSYAVRNVKRYCNE